MVSCRWKFHQMALQAWSTGWDTQHNRNNTENVFASWTNLIFFVPETSSQHDDHFSPGAGNCLRTHHCKNFLGLLEIAMNTEAPRDEVNFFQHTHTHTHTHTNNMFHCQTRITLGKNKIRQFTVWFVALIICCSIISCCCSSVTFGPFVLYK